MVGLIGADVEALERLAADVGGGADELRELSEQLARSIDDAHDWQGPDATRCKDEWGTFAHTQMTGVADALAAAGRLLRQNAEEQERASGADSAGGAATAGAAAGYGVLKAAGDATSLGWWVSKLTTAVGKAKSLVTFVSQLVTRNLAELASSERLLAALKGLTGEAPGLVVRLLSKVSALEGAAKLLGRASLPVVFLSGLKDLVTGGDHDGWRRLATRGFAVAGMAGAATLVVGGGAALVATAPITATVAGIGVAAYGAWSAGSYVWDHRAAAGAAFWRMSDAVGVSEPLRSAGSAVSSTVTHGLDAAKSWARGLLGTPTPSPAGA